MAGLTRSQLLFPIYTDLDAGVLEINGSDFTLFVDLRVEQQWVLNSWKWLDCNERWWFQEFLTHLDSRQRQTRSGGNIALSSRS